MPRQKRPAAETALPAYAGRVAKDHPHVWEAFSLLGAATAEAGPLSTREQRLVKTALAMAGGSEGGTHSHVRRGLAEGLTHEEFRHIALLAITTLGWPAAVKGLSWIEDVAPPKRQSRAAAAPKRVRSERRI